MADQTPKETHKAKLCPSCGQNYEGTVIYCPKDGQFLLPIPQVQSTLVDTILNNKYRILQKLGSGGMGQVYLAEQVNLNRRVAIKFLHSDTPLEDEAIRRFKSEAVAIGQLSHPNIVTIYELEQTPEGDLYIAMEYVGGSSLRQILEREGRLAAPRAIAIAKQVSRALTEAHSKSIIHRDIKPENIMVSSTVDEEDHVKVLDFGIAKLREGTLSGTKTGLLMGTPNYMSFEQASGMSSAQIDARSDIYSLGVVLYEMLSGRAPFRASTTMATLMKHVSEMPPPLSTVVSKPDFPEEVSSLVQRCLAKDRNQRPSTARLLATELEHLETSCRRLPSAAATSENDSNRTVLAPPSPIPEPPKVPPVEKAPTMKPVIKPPARAVTPPAVKPKEGTPSWIIAVAAILIITGGVIGGIYFLLFRKAAEEYTGVTVRVATPATLPQKKEPAVPPTTLPAGQEPASPPTTVPLQTQPQASQVKQTAQDTHPYRSDQTSKGLPIDISRKTDSASQTNIPNAESVTVRTTADTIPQNIITGLQERLQQAAKANIVQPPASEKTEAPKDATSLSLPATTFKESPGTEGGRPTAGTEPSAGTARKLIAGQASGDRMTSRLIDEPSGVRDIPAVTRTTYSGPPAGVVVWSGEADKNQDLVIEGSTANRGTLQGNLPGVPCIVHITDPNAAIAEAPSPSNAFRKMVVRFNRKGKFTLRIQWEVLK